jgi:hypothetical protein
LIQGFQNFGLQLTASSIIAYVVDCYREKAAEAAAPPKLMQTLFAFGFTYYVNDWLATAGPGPFFYTIAGLVAASNLTTIPMYFNWEIRLTLGIFMASVFVVISIATIS